MMRNSPSLWIVISVAIIAGALSGSFMTILMQEKENKETLIKSFYDTENAVHVSPHSIRKHMMEGDGSFILVDLRSKEEYEREHIIGAISIPAYKDLDTSAYDDVDRIVAEFSKLPADKDVIVYCYSTPCMTGRKIGAILADHDIYVQHLGIGWNEWRYDWTSWNHEHEWNQTDVNDYITSGSEQGVFDDQKILSGCLLSKDLGC